MLIKKKLTLWAHTQYDEPTPCAISTNEAAILAKEHLRQIRGLSSLKGYPIFSEDCNEGIKYCTGRVQAMVQSGLLTDDDVRQIKDDLQEEYDAFINNHEAQVKARRSRDGFNQSS